MIKGKSKVGCHLLRMLVVQQLLLPLLSLFHYSLVVYASILSSWDCPLLPMERIAVSVDKRTNHNQTTTTNTNNSRHWYLNITTSYVGNLLTWNTYRPFVFDTDESNILSVSLEQPPLEDKTIEENNNNVKNVSSITTTTVYRNLKHCPCAQPLLNEGIPNVEYYWETSTYCHVYNSQSGEGGVNCIKYKNWTVSYVRSSWYYICFVVVLLVLFLLCSKTGHNAIKYPISHCFPSLNGWITHHLLQDEIQDVQNRIREQHRATTALSMTIGSVSGYSIKTKTYSKRTNNYCHDDDDDDDDFMCCTCTICLFEINIGERVSDLACGHMYHPDCLCEWILKKNSCPLCQDQDIAKEIRTYENVNNGILNTVSSSSSSSSSGSAEEQGGIFHQWQCKAYARFVAIATGRN